VAVALQTFLAVFELPLIFQIFLELFGHAYLVRLHLPSAIACCRELKASDLVQLTPVDLKLRVPLSSTSSKNSAIFYLHRCCGHLSPAIINCFARLSRFRGNSHFILTGNFDLLSVIFHLAVSDQHSQYSAFSASSYNFLT